MSLPFQAVIDRIIAKEKGYVNNPSDRGGPTNFGITQVVARANNYMGNMKDLPKLVAEQIYLKRYITGPKFDRVHARNERIGMEMIDTGVNMGVSIPGPWLQRWLNVMNIRGTKYADLFVDGDIGPATMDALDKYLDFRGQMGEDVMVYALNSLQAVRYLDIAEANEKQEDFAFGWLAQRVVAPA